MHVNELRALVPAGDTELANSQHILLRAAHQLGHTDSDQVFVHCEAPGCDRDVSVADAHSLAAVYRMPGRGYAAYQCPYEQHLACSFEHAVLAMADCLQRHIAPGGHA